MSFKALGDKQRQRALIPFLQAANCFQGHLVGLIVTKELARMAAPDGDILEWPKRLGLRGKWKETSLEAVLRTAHFFALFLSLWSRPGMHVTWITDEDEIVANEDRLDDAQQLAARLTSMYVPHLMGVFAMNSTAIDERDREDFVAIPDLAAGMLAEVSHNLTTEGTIRTERIKIDSQKFTEKTDTIAD
jgi:hypothetical protein